LDAAPGAGSRDVVVVRRMLDPTIGLIDLRAVAGHETFAG
jgi:hypothetical protein